MVPTCILSMVYRVNVYWLESQSRHALLQTLPVTPPSRPEILDISPDRTTLLLAKNRRGGEEAPLCAVPTSGGAPRQIRECGRRRGRPRSPDGATDRSLARGPSLFRAALHGSGLRKLLDTPGISDWFAGRPCPGQTFCVTRFRRATPALRVCRRPAAMARVRRSRPWSSAHAWGPPGRCRRYRRTAYRQKIFLVLFGAQRRIQRLGQARGRPVPGAGSRASRTDNLHPHGHLLGMRGELRRQTRFFRFRSRTPPFGAL